MHKLVFFSLVIAGLATAAEPAPAESSAAEPAAKAAATRPPPDTHGVDMRTQAGPPGPRYSPPVPVDAKLPTFWLIGDSTVRNGSAGDGTNLNQWGWGAPLTFYFDPQKVNVVNRALGGTSARSFYNANWKRMVDLIKPGDVVILQFGTNDGGDPTRSVGEIKGIGDETREIKNRAGEPETVHTFGWYLRQFIAEARAKGATPIVCSLIPRKSWDDAGHIRRARDSFAGWAGEVAKAENVGFIDLNELIARRLDVLGKEKVDQLYVPNPTPEKPNGETVHPGWDGAVINAEVVVSGLKALGEKNPVAAWFSEKAGSVAPAD
ncbi:MAG TPA: rhamnogalacturonan acetylesterase [Opitutaceae bacterium]|nr:rhamnogalacturonan acetylesterase [Opitutaceae bacterium]